MTNTTKDQEPVSSAAWNPQPSKGASPLGQLTLIRFREFLREPEAVFWTFIFPLLLAGGLGLAFRSRPADVAKIGVLTSAPAAGFISATLAGDSSLQLVSLGDTAAVNALRIGTVALVVVASDSQRVEYRFDRARTEARTARLLVDQALQRSRGRRDAVATTDALITERGSRYIDFVLPGLLAMNLMGSGMWGIGFSIVDARKKKLLKRFVATPMRRYHYLGSFLVMRLGLMVIEVTVIATFGHFAFGVPMRGSLVAFGVTCLLGALVFGSLGLLVASRARTIEAASGLMNLLMLPMWVASGVFFSAGNFPDAVQPFIQALPLTAVVDSVRGIMIQGLGWSALLPEFAIVTTWLVLSFSIALRFFRWR